MANLIVLFKFNYILKIIFYLAILTFYLAIYYKLKSDKEFLFKKK